jgi:hypothetical protein
MTAHGYSGNARYLIAPGGLACVAAGVGFARLGGMVAWRTPRPPLVAGVLALALIGLSLPWVIPRVDVLRAEGRLMRHEARVNGNIATAVERAGGAERVRRCGGVYTGPFEVPLVAWQLHLHFSGVGLDPRAPGTVFQTRVAPNTRMWPLPPRGFTQLAAVDPWRVFTSCAA